MTAGNTKPGRGYIYVEMTIHDPEGFKNYTALSAPAVRAAGGRYVVMGRGRNSRRLRAGDPIALVEFESADRARDSITRPLIRRRARSGSRRPNSA